MNPRADDALADVLRDAVGLLVSGDRVAADQALASPDRPDVEPRRKLSLLLEARVFARDSYQCRYCGGRTLPPTVIWVLRSVWPHLTWRKQGGTTIAHEIGAKLFASVDDVVAGAEHGAWRDPSNLVTACYLCNGRKSNLSLDELGWKLLPVEPGWDGLTGTFGLSGASRA
jgi:5-methylcytosine-specific restriction endonuclease McrA